MARSASPQQLALISGKEVARHRQAVPSASAAARSQPLTPPIARVGHRQSQAPAARLRPISCGPHQFSPIWIGTAHFARIVAWPAKSSAKAGSSTHSSPSPPSAWPAGRLGDRKRLVVVDHQPDFGADGAAHRAHHVEVGLRVG